MNAKHTKGPWSIGKDEHGYKRMYQDDGTYGIYSASHCLVAETVGGLLGQEANARLIAAAPELLEALEELVSAVKDGQRRYSGGHDPLAIMSNAIGATVRQAEAAIAKAEGQPAAARS